MKVSLLQYFSLLVLLSTIHTFCAIDRVCFMSFGLGGFLDQSSPLIEPNAKTMQVIYWSLIEESIFQPCTILLFICNCIFDCERLPFSGQYSKYTQCIMLVAFHLVLAKEISKVHKCEVVVRTYMQGHKHKCIVHCTGSSIF